uniref:Cytidine and deoxycytidylate deaminase-like protein n=1 Tax=Antonospora locustae TaxID=278021 RepID=Q6E6I7_ANTLO|nr:cytidine and deoxycytidylate deaminase-like protein [Antonospora locustae]
MDYNSQFMDEAVSEAEKALEAGEVPVGCVVVREDAVISRGHNMTNRESDPLAHAELVALRHCASAESLVFYITCEPCIMCLGVLGRIRARVFYGCRNPIFGGTTVLGGVSEALCTHVHRESAVRLLQRFFLMENCNAPPNKRRPKEKRQQRHWSPQ